MGGKSPHDGLDLKDWLKSPADADIYVLGYAYNHINELSRTFNILFGLIINYITIIMFCLGFKKSCH